MDLKHVIDNNLRDHLIVSDYDADSFGPDVELCLGIDEAGRGPVLGPMVYSGLFCPIDKEQELKEMECADSKTLSEKDREKIFHKIIEHNKFCGFAIKILSPHTISTGMLGKEKYNLNELSHDTAMAIIDKLYNGQKLNITHVYLDTVGDPTKYEIKLSKRFPKLKIKVSKKADSLFPCVSAASICAKVTRDTVLKDWVYTENIAPMDYGSGYPGDPLTKKYLDACIDPVFGFVKLVRFSWSTAALKMKKSCVKVKWSDLEEEDDGDDDDDVVVVEDKDVICEDAEENEQSSTRKSTRTKKPPAKPSKLSVAVAKEKNNGSLLNFFQKSQQKRTVDSASAANCTEIVSHFMVQRKFKVCSAF